MRKNILTIIIMAIVLINTVLTGVLIFVIVPTSNRTTKLVDKIASIVDLELEDPDVADANLTVLDKEGFDVSGELKIYLKKGSDGNSHYALISTVTIYMNKKSDDYEELSEAVQNNTNKIKEIITDEVSKYSIDNITDSKDAIKEAVLIRLKEYFKSDFIIDVSFGNMVYA